MSESRISFSFISFLLFFFLLWNSFLFHISKCNLQYFSLQKLLKSITKVDAQFFFWNCIMLYEIEMNFTIIVVYVNVYYFQPRSYHPKTNRIYYLLRINIAHYGIFFLTKNTQTYSFATNTLVLVKIMFDYNSVNNWKQFANKK